MFHPLARKAVCTLFSLKHPQCSSNMFCVSQAHISSISHFSNDFPADIKSENSTFAEQYKTNARKVGKHPDNIRIFTSNCFTYILLIVPWSL